VREAMSRVAGKVIGATVEGLISGTQGAADGIRSGWRRASQSIAGRPGMAWAKGLVGGIRRTPKGIRDGWSTGSQSSRRLGRSAALRIAQAGLSCFSVAVGRHRISLPF
jgi:hypothetical protein